jgi:hypothetical protein
MPEDNLITIGRYSTPYEANLAKSKLRTFGVLAFLEDDCTINTNWMWSNALGGVNVCVPASQVEEARNILEIEPPEEPAAAAVCPVCGSIDTRSFVDKRGAVLTWLLLGLPLLAPIPKIACRTCGRTSKA